MKHCKKSKSTWEEVEIIFTQVIIMALKKNNQAVMRHLQEIKNCCHCFVIQGWLEVKSSPI